MLFNIKKDYFKLKYDMPSIIDMHSSLKQKEKKIWKMCVDTW